MNKLVFLLLMLIAGISYSHANELPLDFESSPYAITDFDGGVLTVIDNPQSVGINTSPNVAQMIKNPGEQWGGSYITLDDAIDFSENKFFKMKVFSPKVGTKVLLKVENSSDGSISFEKEELTKRSNEWEVLSFDFRAIDASQVYRNIVLIFELGTEGDGSADFTFLLDDIFLGEGDEEVDAPTSAAPKPPEYDAIKVISIFSEAFATLDGTNYNPYWGQSTIGSIDSVEGNEILKLDNLDYHGFELAHEVNAAGMKYMHIDVWTSNETSLDVYPISKTTGEQKAQLSPLNLMEWNSFDVKLSDLAIQDFNLADLFQMKFIGAGGNTIYIDNLYFYDDNPVPDTEDPTDFTAEISDVTYNSLSLSLNAEDNAGALNYLITVGGTTIKVGAASGITKEYEFMPLPSATEFSFSIVAEDLAGNGAANSPIELVATTQEAYPEPSEGSPTPIFREDADVISIFSDAFTNVANTNFNPWWGQATWFTSVQIGGNEVLKYENMNYQGIELGNIIDASGLDYLHIDVWTPNSISLNVSPISVSSGEKPKQLVPLRQNEWNGYDISLSTFTVLGLSMNDISQLKFVSSSRSIIYIDNIYFYKGDPNSIADQENQINVSCYPNPVSNDLNISADSQIKNVSVYSIAGHLVLSNDFNVATSKLNVNGLEQGNYIVSVTLFDGKTQFFKIVKQ